MFFYWSYGKYSQYGQKSVDFFNAFMFLSYGKFDHENENYDSGKE